MYIDEQPSVDTEKQKKLLTDDERNMQLVDKKYYTLKHVPKECLILDFCKTIEGITYKPGLGYGFYEFTKPELIQHEKQVMLMDQVSSLLLFLNINNNLFYRVTSCTMALVLAMQLVLYKIMMKLKKSSQTLTEIDGSMSSFRHVQKTESFNQTRGFYIVSYSVKMILSIMHVLS